MPEELEAASMPAEWERYKVDVPEGVSPGGRWRVEHFEIPEAGAAFHNMVEAVHGTRRFVVPGTFTRLLRGRRHPVTVMSDTPAEIGDHLRPIRRAHGNCLVSGLGLGVVVNGMLLKDEVTHVTVIEKSPSVIALVGPHYMARWGGRLTIVAGDAEAIMPAEDARYDVVWHDIWDTISADNLPQMKRLCRRYRPHIVDGGWQGCWGRRLIPVMG